MVMKRYGSCFVLDMKKVDLHLEWRKWKKQVLMVVKTLLKKSKRSIYMLSDHWSVFCYRYDIELLLKDLPLKQEYGNLVNVGWLDHKRVGNGKRNRDLRV